MEPVQSIDIAQHINLNLDTFLDGKSYLITKNGQPVAEINPVVKKTAGFKRKRNKVTLSGGMTAAGMITRERAS